MSNCAVVIVLVEGPTEQNFVKQILAPYLAERGVYLVPIILSKHGENGGDVKFSRAQRDIRNYLRQRSGTFLTLFVDYYGIKGDWPGYQDSRRQATHTGKAEIIKEKTAAAVQQFLPACETERRFIPYFSMHEIEALYFSDPACLAEKLGVEKRKVDEIIRECGEPEKINDNPNTAPSKRLKNLSNRFRKTSTGIDIAEAIGIPKMREKCPLFNSWLCTLESLGEAQND